MWTIEKTYVEMKWSFVKRTLGDLVKCTFNLEQRKL